MSFLPNIISKKNEPVKSYADFWDWFKCNEKKFFNVVKKHEKIEEDFFDKLSIKLVKINEGYYFLAGMHNDNTAELIFTADANPANIVFIEELVAEAPKLEGWKFTALKPALDINDVSIEIYGFEFNSSNLYFYSTDHKEYPDEIDITVIHTNFTKQNKDEITSGTYLFLDNYLGELDFLNTIDNINVISPNQAEKELIPISKLKDFLVWRQKEFVEKYNEMRHNTQNDTYSSFEGTIDDDKPAVAIINTTLLSWDGKASHPWILKIQITYNGDAHNGFPDSKTLELLYEFEDKINHQLSDAEGYLNIGRETADNIREIYFACVDFRKPSKVLHKLKHSYASKFEIDFFIYKDKYWQTFERFMKHL